MAYNLLIFMCRLIYERSAQIHTYRFHKDGSEDDLDHCVNFEPGRSENIEKARLGRGESVRESESTLLTHCR